MGKSDSCSISTQTLHKKEQLQVYWEKEREKETCSFGMELCFIPAPPLLCVLSWVEGWRSQWHSTPFPVPNSPWKSHGRRILESKEWVWGHRELIVQEISWKAWTKYLKKNTELPPTLSNCISHCIVFNHYSGTMTCGNLLPQLHLAFAWQSLIKMELLGLQNKHLIKAECF